MNDLPQVREKGAARFLPDPVVVIVVCAIGLTILGLTILFSASASFKQGPYFYLNKQLLGIGGAIALCITTVKVNLDQLRKYVWYILGALLFLLFLVLIPHIGIRVNGSRRWLGVGSLRVQIWYGFLLGSLSSTTANKVKRVETWFFISSWNYSVFLYLNNM